MSAAWRTPVDGWRGDARSALQFRRWGFAQVGLPGFFSGFGEVAGLERRVREALDLHTLGLVGFSLHGLQLFFVVAFLRVEGLCAIARLRARACGLCRRMSVAAGDRGRGGQRRHQDDRDQTHQTSPHLQTTVASPFATCHCNDSESYFALSSTFSPAPSTALPALPMPSPVLSSAVPT